MDEPSKYLEKSWKRRTDESRRKALDAIESLKKKNAPVNFNSVQKESGVSKHYLYEHEEIRTIIEAARSEEAERASAWHKKYDRTSKSKDVLISAKDKRIAKLEEENQQLKRELETLRRLLYEKK
ncbi:MAG: transposase [Oribacterium sp.]|nr:transposase [Oribacterium sp.]